MFATLSFKLVPRITAGFGQTDSVHSTPHTGVDVAVPIGTKLYSPSSGIVSRIADYGDTSLGKAVFVKTRSGYQYIYGHLSDVKVRLGDRVHSGELLALSGNTGNSTGPHVHFGLVDKAGAFVDPTGFVDKITDKAVDSIRERASKYAYETVMGVLDALKDLAVDLSYSIALIGGGLAIILHVAGWKDGARWAGILTVSYALIKYLLG